MNRFLTFYQIDSWLCSQPAIPCHRKYGCVRACVCARAAFKMKTDIFYVACENTHVSHDVCSAVVTWFWTDVKHNWHVSCRFVSVSCAWALTWNVSSCPQSSPPDFFFLLFLAGSNNLFHENNVDLIVCILLQMFHDPQVSAKCAESLVSPGINIISNEWVKNAVHCLEFCIDSSNCESIELKWSGLFGLKYRGAIVSVPTSLRSKKARDCKLRDSVTHCHKIAGQY